MAYIHGYHKWTISIGSYLECRRILPDSHRFPPQAFCVKHSVELLLRGAATPRMGAGEDLRVGVKRCLAVSEDCQSCLFNANSERRSECGMHEQRDQVEW